jgi:hypothetical protein
MYIVEIWEMEIVLADICKKKMEFCIDTLDCFLPLHNFSGSKG